MAKRCTVCVVDVTGGQQVHFRKITVEVDPAEATAKILELFAGQMVTANSRKKKPAICAETERSEEVKGGN